MDDFGVPHWSHHLNPRFTSDLPQQLSGGSPLAGQHCWPGGGVSERRLVPQWHFRGQGLGRNAGNGWRGVRDSNWPFRGFYLDFRGDIMRMVKMLYLIVQDGRIYNETWIRPFYGFYGGYDIMGMQWGYTHTIDKNITYLRWGMT